ncbi:CBS domain-containing protein [Wenzhouxiangella sediminis]|uniref:CBS domain-containing protein n=1 Tax=Wenzhouxiangella sediminis TaxID=1792836 RepID=A0A3E1KBW1_9GAMM|nr:CBS domain-containing protein [Wenzhouxiangella sediminis]RFF32189.1 CBS domain-containing protein [Wenzhouxiangella sediminis]
MGEQNVEQTADEQTRRAFMKALLDEVRALEDMLDAGMIESGIRRIGAEQEMFLVDQASRPALTAMQILETIDDPRFTHELGLFNLEANLSPLELGGDCLRQLEKEADEVLGIAREKASAVGSRIALVGILPTLTREHMSLEAMVPTARYFALNEALLRLRGSNFNFAIKGIDQLSINHDNLMLEACNTSFQVHFQVGAEEFAHLYNIAQAVTGPLLASCVNSPILLGKRLWHETRIAVFEHSIDARSEAHAARGHKPRVHFGDHWIDESVIEIFKEDIARFRVVLTTEFEKDPIGMVARGEVPRLRALCLHNGTVYRWNRACYGISDNGKPHLRIENRVIPSGPTVLDEVANAAFFFGMMSRLSNSVEDIREHLNFSDVKSNFLAAAREGLRAQQVWFDDRQVTAQELILDELLPMAREGLFEAGIDERDIDRYLGVIRGRVENRRTGARWQLESLESMREEGNEHERLRALVSSMVDLSESGKPVSEWELAGFCNQQDWRDSYRHVGQFMATDLFTVRPDDIVDFAASLMEWRHVRHVPVEDDSGQLLGLVSHRQLLRLIARGNRSDEGVTVRDIMRPDPITVTPETTTVEAIRLMRDNRLSSLPVVEDGKLVGLVTEYDLIVVASRLLESYLSEDQLK